MRELTAYEIEEVNGGFYRDVANCLTILWTAYQVMQEINNSTEGGASASTNGDSTSSSASTGSGCVAVASISEDGTQTSVTYCPE